MNSFAIKNIIRAVGAIATTFGLMLVDKELPGIGYPLMTFGLYWLVVELKD